MTDSEKVDKIIEALEALKRGELTIVSCIVAIGMIANPKRPVSQETIQWAIKRAEELGYEKNQ